MQDEHSGIAGYMLSKKDVEPTSWDKVSTTDEEVTVEETITLNGTYYLYI